MDYNNFHCYLPGGLYRTGGLFQKEFPNQAIGKKLDHLVLELKFDTAKFYRLKEESQGLVEMTVEGEKKALGEKKPISPQEQRIIDQMLQRQKILYQEIASMLKPLYDKMVAFGYSHNELTD